MTRFPFPVRDQIDIRINPKNVDNVFMTYPYYKDASVIKLKEIANVPPDYGDIIPTFTSCSLHDSIDNPINSSLNKMTFGVCGRFGEGNEAEMNRKIVSIFPQETRIDLINDVISNEISFKFLINEGLVLEYDGLH